mgnify:CR=1 FL=1
MQKEIFNITINKENEEEIKEKLEKLLNGKIHISLMELITVLYDTKEEVKEDNKDSDEKEFYEGYITAFEDIIQTLVEGYLEDNNDEDYEHSEYKS